MKIKIDIDTMTFVRFWLVVIGFGLAGLAIYMAKSALILVVVSFFLALALNAPVHFLAKFMPGKSRLGGTAAAYVIVVALLTSFLLLVIPSLVSQSVHFAESVPSLIDKNKNQIEAVGQFIERHNLQPQVDQAVAGIKDNANQWAANIGINVVNGIGSIFGMLLSLILVLVMTFLMLLEGPTWMKRIWGIYRNDELKSHHQMLVRKMYNVMSGYVNGQLAVAAIGGIMAGSFVFGMSFFVADAPGNLALPVAAITFFLSLVPMFGATIAGVIIMIMLALSSIPAAVIFTIYFVIYQQIENNFISPVVQAKTIQLSALVVLLAVTIGTYVFGLAGGLISIPIAGWIKVLLEDYLTTRKAAADKKESTPIAKLKKLATHKS
ncbi:MAG: AI-2E family transporter [Candidatus Saccharibacteria bacterium]|nr:AI-2E family transporter [Candidatus Saccharibacteria bacterium]